MLMYIYISQEATAYHSDLHYMGHVGYLVKLYIICKPCIHVYG